MDNDKLLIFGPQSIDKHVLLTHLHQNDDTPTPTPTTTPIQTIQLKTKYYTTSIDVWIDEFEQLAEWCEEYSSEEAREVREVLGGLVYCFQFGDVERLEGELAVINSFVGRLKDKQDDDDDDWEGLKVCIGYGEVDDGFEDYEDVCLQNGWECVQLDDDRGVNEFKERVGVDRFKEIIECHGWSITEDVKKKTTVNEEDNAMDLEQMVNMIKEEKLRIAQLPHDEDREREAIKFIESLNLS